MEQNREPAQRTNFRIIDIPKEPKVSGGKFSAFTREELEEALDCATSENVRLIRERNELRKSFGTIPEIIDQMICFLLTDGVDVDEAISDLTGMEQHELLALLMKDTIFNLEEDLKEAKEEIKSLEKKPKET